MNAKVGFEPVTTPVWVFCAESNCGIRTRDPMQFCDGVSFALCHRCISCDGVSFTLCHRCISGCLLSHEVAAWVSFRSPIDSSVYGGFKSTFRGARSVSPRGANKERHHAARCRSGAAHRFAASPGSTNISVASCARPAGPCDCSCISQTSPAAQSDLGLISTARDCTR